MGQVTELWLSCYLVLLLIDSRKPGNKTAAVLVTWPIYVIHTTFCFSFQFFHVIPVHFFKFMGIWKQNDDKCFDNEQLIIGWVHIKFFSKQTIGWIEYLTHWGRVTHMSVSKLTIIGSDNGLSPDWRQAIIWTNPGTFSLKKMRLKVSSAKRRPFCLGLNVLTWQQKLVEVWWSWHHDW